MKLVPVLFIALLAATSCKKEKENVINSSFSNSRLTSIHTEQGVVYDDVFEYDQYGYVIKFTRSFAGKGTQPAEKRMEIVYLRNAEHNITIEKYKDTYNGQDKTALYTYNNQNKLVRVLYGNHTPQAQPYYLEYVWHSDKVTAVKHIDVVKSDTTTLCEISYDTKGNVTRLFYTYDSSPGESSPKPLVYDNFTHDNNPNNTIALKGLDNFYPIYMADPQLLSANNITGFSISNRELRYTLQYNKHRLVSEQENSGSKKTYTYGNYIQNIGVQ